MVGISKDSLQIPDKMAEKLRTKIGIISTSQTLTWEDVIIEIFNKAQKHISDHMLFFPHYTAHGIGHINAVLMYAFQLIPEETMGKLDGKSLFVLIAGIILHDLGMHLDAAEVKKILSDGWAQRWVDKEETKTWKAAWDDYLQEVRRYSDDKLFEQFGQKITVSEPNWDVSDISWNDRLLVGEFLRRYHHILALGIQQHGFPTGTNMDMILRPSCNIGTSLDNFWSLAGFLAMSHGLSIREAEKYIYEKFGDGSRPADVPIFYLMAVLRVADYLDAGAHRVAEPRSRENALPPVSKAEHIRNQRTDALSFTWYENKAELSIQAAPQGTIEFVRLEKWLRLLHQELDTSWGAIAKYYGADSWKLKIQHIHSNILDPVSRPCFDKDFITKEARLKADPELLKLLVEPLYESDPSCGVRELIQNAVDACTERSKQKEIGYTGTVEVCLDTKNNTLTVTDNGVGMDENVILNYYLSAGASYRNSEEWLSQYADGRDPNIIRNGHFGVGVLATFLLGNKVHVMTRRSTDPGYVFEFGLEPKPLDIRRPKETRSDGTTVTAEISVGTTITVELKEEALTKLLEDYCNEDAQQTWLNWYRFETPSVSYVIDNKPCKIRNDLPPVPQKADPSNGWFDLQVNEEEAVERQKFQALLWGYPHDGFFCNGIRIPWGMKDSYKYNDITVIPPSVSVIDKNGALQMDIARRFLGKSPLWEALEREVIRYHMAQLLTADWSEKEEAAVAGIPTILSTNSNLCTPIVCAKEHYTLMHTYFLTISRTTGKELTQQTRILILHIKKGAQPNEITDFIQNLEPKIPFIVHPERLDMSDPQQIACKVIEGFGKPPFESLYYDTQCLRIFIPRKLWSNKPDEKLGSTDIWSCGDCDRPFAKYLHNKEDSETSHFDENIEDADVCLAISEIKYSVDARSKSNLHDESKYDLWNFVKTHMGGDPWIPYKVKKRETKFSEAFNVLEPYIKSIKEKRSKT